MAERRTTLGMHQQHRAHRNSSPFTWSAGALTGIGGVVRARGWCAGDGVRRVRPHTPGDQAVTVHTGAEDARDSGKCLSPGGDPRVFVPGNRPERTSGAPGRRPPPATRPGMGLVRRRPRYPGQVTERQPVVYGRRPLWAIQASGHCSRTFPCSRGPSGNRGGRGWTTASPGPGGRAGRSTPALSPARAAHSAPRTGGSAERASRRRRAPPSSRISWTSLRPPPSSGTATGAICGPTTPTRTSTAPCRRNWSADTSRTSTPRPRPTGSEPWTSRYSPGARPSATLCAICAGTAPRAARSATASRCGNSPVPASPASTWTSPTTCGPRRSARRPRRTSAPCGTTAGCPAPCCRRTGGSSRRAWRPPNSSISA